ncbi:MAG TPA: hypothetical protein VIF15_20570 [Polyangiaceae bacterium]|jgi:hypothetical protein
MRALALGLLLASALSSGACATYEDDLGRAEKAFEASENERALAIFRVLEVDTGRLSETDRAHYAYLRGMTDYRMGYKAEARHWLSVATALEQKTPGSLPADWAKRMNDAVKELNESVYTGGIESLTNDAVARAKAGDDDTSSDSDSSGSDAPKKSKPKPDKSDDQ